MDMNIIDFYSFVAEKKEKMSKEAENVIRDRYMASPGYKRGMWKKYRKSFECRKAKEKYLAEDPLYAKLCGDELYADPEIQGLYREALDAGRVPDNSGQLGKEVFARLLEEKGAEEVYDFMCSAEDHGGKTIETCEAGYEEMELACQAYNDSSSAQAVAYLVKYEEGYFVWRTESILRGEGIGEWEETPEYYSSLEDAETAFQEMVDRGYPPLEDQIDEFLAAFPYDIHVKVWSSLYCSFRIYYKHLLVAEHLHGLDADAIKEGIEKIERFEKENNVSLSELYKLPRGWNCNQRYYRISGTSGFGYFSTDVHIPSATQGRFRYPIDIILASKDNIVDQIANSEKQMAQKAEENAREMAKETGNTALTAEEKISLFQYLKDNNAMMDCDGTLKLTESWMADNTDPSRKEDIIRELNEGGGYCDCEVVANYFAPPGRDYSDVAEGTEEQ